MKRTLIVMLACGLLLAIPMSTHAQKKKKRGKKSEIFEIPKKKGGLEDYKEIITEDVISDQGLFTVHKVKDKYYFELPNNLLEKEILIVSRISASARGTGDAAGKKSNPQQVIRFQRLENKILMRSVSYGSVANKDLPIYTSVKNNNFEPIVMSFDLKTIAADSTSVVFQVNDLFTTDVKMIGGMNRFGKRKLGIMGLDRSRSFITGMKSFPKNVLINHILTYRGGDKLPGGALPVGMTQSMMLLPEEPMIPRRYDERVGYSGIYQQDYGTEEHKTAERQYICKWRLEPSDWDAYNRGEAVDPVKPIVYYIDPATPKKWRKYIKQGVDDWQKAFEKAGFTNAIRGEYAPVDDPDWSPEDVRYSVIRYAATDTQNASGPTVVDPRTGEILESDILFHHNVMTRLRNWFFSQTAAANPAARATQFDDAVMGRLIRYAVAHEVGHTLGLVHNFVASSAYSVDSLRSPSFTSTHGTTPSVMDYARFNYIAQPEDGVTNFYPRIGEYDEWAIYYGYKMIPGIETANQEEKILHGWIVEKADQPEFRYGGGSFDPRDQFEDLGDDSMDANKLGIANLKRIVKKLLEWGTEDGKDYKELKELYLSVFTQYSRYMGHVEINVGGIYQNTKTADQDGMVFIHVSKEKQKRAVDFLNDQLFEMPYWLIDREIFGRMERNFIGDGHTDRIRKIQVGKLDDLLSSDRLIRMIENEAINGSKAYTASSLFSDLRSGIWSELNSGKKIDTYRRNLQKHHIGILIKLMREGNDKALNSDIPSIARANLVSLQSLIRNGISKQSDVPKYHLKDCQVRIKMALEGKDYLKEEEKVFELY